MESGGFVYISFLGRKHRLWLRCHITCGFTTNVAKRPTQAISFVPYHAPYTLPANKTTNQLKAFRNDETPKPQIHDRRAPWLMYTSLPIHFPSQLRAESNTGTAYIL